MIASDSTKTTPALTDNTDPLALQINQELYKRNFELAIRNKTLSLLRDLYNITIESLASEELGKQVARTIRQGLNFELVGLFILNKSNHFLTPIAFSSTPRAKEAEPQLEKKLMNLQIPLVDETNIVYRAINTSKHQESNRLADVWKPTKAEAMLTKVRETCNIHSAVVFPLVNDKGPLGAILFSFNRTYGDLSQFEHESIESIVDVITIALDKSLLYDALRIANEKLRELDSAKSEFMSIASHQLRTPLAGIVGYLSMLEEGDYGKLDDGQSKVVKELYDASQRLVRLVNTFLNVTRIEAGRLTMNFTEVNLVDHVSAEVRELIPTATKKGVTLVLTEPKQLVITAMADSDKIRDVFLNLVDNAIKYTPEGSVTVAIEQPDDKTAHFTVHDTGVGIDPKDAASIFQKFVRGSGIARVQPNGSGLGLFIVKKIVEAHRGKVWMESDGPNKGSTFHVILPLQQPKTATEPETPQTKA